MSKQSQYHCVERCSSLICVKLYSCIAGIWITCGIIIKYGIHTGLVPKVMSKMFFLTPLYIAVCYTRQQKEVSASKCTVSWLLPSILKVRSSVITKLCCCWQLWHDVMESSLDQSYVIKCWSFWKEYCRNFSYDLRGIGGKIAQVF